MPLSPSQHKAVTDTGVQLILAGPGSGKTRVITEKILHLIQKGIKSEHILALTFSDKAAHEMLERLEKQINTSDLTTIFTRQENWITSDELLRTVSLPQII